VGVHAVWEARRATRLPLVGVGGIGEGDDALQYLLAGASLVQVGTASFWDPRSAQRVAKQLERFGREQGVERVTALVGAAHA
jgi:dihydroorotate dehydrogenase (NAD+) catalytic subunit